MNSPIQKKITAVFVPVSDMAAAIAWYSRLFGRPAEGTTHEGRIYSIPMQPGTSIILDGHRPVSNSAQPLCLLATDDIQAAEVFLRANAVAIVRGGIQDIGGAFTLTFQDPDGNLLMACQYKS